MTRNEQLDAVRAACIKANPEIEERMVGDLLEREERPIRLADVLLAIRGTVEDNGEPQTALVFRYWDLHQDDLTQQSDECVAFLYELIK